MSGKKKEKEAGSENTYSKKTGRSSWIDYEPTHVRHFEKILVPTLDGVERIGVLVDPWDRVQVRVLHFELLPSLHDGPPSDDAVHRHARDPQQRAPPERGGQIRKDGHVFWSRNINAKYTVLYSTSTVQYCKIYANKKSFAKLSVPDTVSVIPIIQ